MDKKDVEALLFVAKEPLTLDQMTKMLHSLDETVQESTVIRWVFELQNEYKTRGIHIRQVAGGFEMVTNPECHDIVSVHVPKEYETLSRSVMETVTVVAYNQPVIRAMIARLRNVKNPDNGIQTALEQGLIRESDSGYVTTDAFLKYFGINDLKELPQVMAEERKQATDSSEEESVAETSIEE